MKQVSSYRSRKLRTAALLCAVASSLPTGIAHADPFYMGGDVSLLPFIESRGGTFRDGGTSKPLDQIMVERGSNLFRLRLFVNPNPSYTATNGAIQDLSSTIALATRLKASGAKILLDYHYSDSWADPGQQNKPAAWSALSFDALKTTLRGYTRDSLIAFRDAGVMPEMVQVGNEVTNGMLWSSGQVVYTGSTSTQNQSWRNFGDLLNSAIAGVRDVDATVPGQHTTITIHADGGSVAGRAAYYYNKLTTTALVPPSSYEVLGLSFYPTATDALSNLQSNLNFIANSTPVKAMVLEANQPWKGSANGSQWASTATGQRDYWIAVRDAVKNLPSDKGLGALWWYPEAIQVPGTTIWQGGRIALFDDSGGDSLPALAEFTNGASAWAVNANGSWIAPTNWVGAVPNATAQLARFGPNISAPRTISIDSPVSVSGIGFASSQRYTLNSTGSITLDARSGPTRIEVIQGSHLVDVPITAIDAVEISVAWTHSLTLTKPLNAVGQRVTKVGSGVANIDRIDAATIDVQFGRLALSGTAPGVVQSLQIGVKGTLELQDGLILDPPSTGLNATQDSVRNLIRSGRFVGIVGFADASAIGVTQFLGVSVDASSILLRATTPGDANLDHAVDFDDLLLLAQHYGTNDALWWQGDFNSDLTVNFDDLLALAQRYGSPAFLDVSGIFSPMSSFGDDFRLAMSLVPEPTIAGTLALAGIATATRRRGSAHQIGLSSTSDRTSESTR